MDNTDRSKRNATKKLVTVWSHNDQWRSAWCNVAQVKVSPAMGSSKTDQTALERVSLIEIKWRTEEEAEKDGRTGDGEQKQKPHTEMWPFRHELQKEPSIPANRKPKAICYKSRLLARFMQVDQVSLLRANLFRNYVLRQTTAFGRQSATFLERTKVFPRHWPALKKVRS